MTPHASCGPFTKDTDRILIFLIHNFANTNPCPMRLQPANRGDRSYTGFVCRKTFMVRVKIIIMILTNIQYYCPRNDKQRMYQYVDFSNVMTLPETEKISNLQWKLRLAVVAMQQHFMPAALECSGCAQCTQQRAHTHQSYTIHNITRLHNSYNRMQFKQSF
jgi:hypothetical protein